MLDRKLMRNFVDRCDIYFEGSLISKELLIKTYADFIAASFAEKDHAVGVMLHTGSVCFDIISILASAFGSLILDGFDADTVISSLNEGDMVQYKSNRYFWGGFGRFEGRDNGFVSVSDIEDATHFLLIQRKPDRYLGESVNKTMVPLAGKNLVIPYNGDSEITDGRGLRRGNTNRTAFITYLFDVPAAEIPSTPGVSSVIVAERDTADRIIRGLAVSYGDNETVNLLDIVTVSYFTDAEEYRYAGNPGRNDPVLKITGKISTARDLILDKSGNKAVGLLVLGSESILKGRSELPELLNRKSLRYVYLSANIDSENTGEILKECEELAAAIFACTREFLLTHSLPAREKNRLTAVLDRQVENIENRKVGSIVIPCACTWENYRAAKETLYSLRKFDWNGVDKDLFIINAYSLLNFFTTAVFPVRRMDRAINDGLLSGLVVSPRQQINELRRLADKLPTFFADRAVDLIDLLERLYAENETVCRKYDALKELLRAESGRRIAVIVPKAYYADVLAANETFPNENVTVVTANRFDNSVIYDKIIVVGDFSGRRFDAFKCCAASDITVLLYDYESRIFGHKETAARRFENELDRRTGTVSEDNEFLSETSDEHNGPSEDEILKFRTMTTDLDFYIDKIGEFDIRSLIGQSSATGATATANVVATGIFTDGGRILFSKYYRAFVFDKARETVTETDVEKLDPGDILVFTRRDDFTKNMVDNIFDNLLSSGRLIKTIKEASFKSAYWKLALREYMDRHACSYRDISERLSALGCKRHEVTIRAWLHDDNRIVGPLDEEAFVQIAELTSDPDMKRDPKSFYEACRIVRHERREILNLVGRAIIDKLRGHLSERGGLLEAVYENVDKLSVISELESVTELDKPTAIPINMINRPLTA
jgi:hypothetical protein